MRDLKDRVVGAILFVGFDMALLEAVGAFSGGGSLLDRLSWRVRVDLVLLLLDCRLLLFPRMSPLLVAVDPRLLCLEPSQTKI